MNEFSYCEYVVGGLQNRNRIFGKQDFRLDSVRVDCFRSLFLFDENLKGWVERTDSVSGYGGKHTADMLVFDFDCDDLDAVRPEVVKFSRYLETEFELPLDYIRLAFSGAKGFHVSMPMEAVGDVTPATNFWQVYRAMCHDLADGFKYVDFKIYEPRRLFRILNTINSKSELYKIPLTLDELDSLSGTKIKELAKQARRVDTLPSTEMRPVPGLREVYKKWASHDFTLSERTRPKEAESDLLQLLPHRSAGMRD